QVMLVSICLGTAAWGADGGLEGVQSSIESAGPAASPLAARARARSGPADDAAPQTPAPPLSPCGVTICRNTETNQLTLSLRGALTSKLVSDTEVLGPTLHLFVYPDELTAMQDSLDEGTGNVFFGETTLGTRVSTVGGLCKEDFILQHLKDGT